MNQLFETIKTVFSKASRAPTERKIADMLANGEVSEDKFSSRIGGKFEPGTTYFGVRLSGLHMTDARRFATEQLPLCVCLAEFENGGVSRTVPFSIGPDIIRAKLKAAGIDGASAAQPAWIELRDIPIVRPTPVNDANLSIYAGLFSVPGNDLVKTLLNVVGTVGSALGQPAVGVGTKVAETVYTSFSSMLALDQVNQVVAALIGSAITESGSGYLLIANVGVDTFDPRVGRVIGGRLCWPKDKFGGDPVVQFDHALLALEYYDTIIEKGTGLAPVLFEGSWGAVRLARNRADAGAALDKLRDAISASADVTEADRIALLSGYSSVAEKLALARWGGGPILAETRGSSTGSASWLDQLSRAAALKKPDDRPLSQALLGLHAEIKQFDIGELNAESREPSSEVREQDEAAIIGVAAAVRNALIKEKQKTGYELGEIVGRAASGLVSN